MTRRAMVQFSLLCLMAAWAVGARAGDVEKGITGAWKVSIEVRGKAGPPGTLKLKQDGEKVTGTMTLPGGMSAEVRDGKFVDGKLSFFVQPGPNGPKIHHLGKLNGDAIKGKLEFERDGNKRPGQDWEAKRVLDP
jgi:hypothetical protein